MVAHIARRFQAGRGNRHHCLGNLLIIGSIYNFSLTMTHTTFLIATWKFYSAPESIFAYATDGPFIVRHVLGFLLILLHIWMSISVFEVLGVFGWFYGDFFIDEFRAVLHDTGIYRYLNNPEKILGHASSWGLALMSGSYVILGLALISQVVNWLFLEYVEAYYLLCSFLMLMIIGRICKNCTDSS